MNCGIANGNEFDSLEGVEVRCLITCAPLLLASLTVEPLPQERVNSRCSEIWQEVEASIPGDNIGQAKWIKINTHHWPSEFWTKPVSTLLASNDADVRVLAAVKLLGITSGEREETNDTLLTVIQEANPRATATRIEKLFATCPYSPESVAELTKLASGNDLLWGDESRMICVFHCENSSATPDGVCSICAAPMTAESPTTVGIGIEALEALATYDLSAASELARLQAFEADTYMARIRSAGVWARTDEEAAMTYLRLLVTQGSRAVNRLDTIGYVSRYWAAEFRSELLATYKAKSFMEEARVTAAVGLLSLGHREAHAALVQATRSSSPVVRSLGFEGLAMYGDKEDLTHLAKFLNGDDRFYAASAIARLEKRLTIRRRLKAGRR